MPRFFQVLLAVFTAYLEESLLLLVYDVQQVCRFGVYCL